MWAVGLRWHEFDVGGSREPCRLSEERETAPSGMWDREEVGRRPAPAQAKTTVRCPLSSTRCSVCQRTACASTRRSTSCPLACSTDTESS